MAPSEFEYNLGQQQQHLDAITATVRAINARLTDVNAPLKLAVSVRGTYVLLISQPRTTMPIIEVPSDDIILDKELRRDIDAIIQRLKSAKPSRERSITTTKLQEAVMWLGMDLKRINEENPGASPNPYPNSKDPSNTKIEPTADGLKL